MSLQRAVKEKDRFEDNSASYRGKRLRAYAALLRANALFLPSALAAAVRPSGLFAPHALERGFFGANCPPSPSADLEDLMFRALADLGLGAVRVDWGYESDRAMVERWIERLLDGGFDVLPHLVQPSAEASRMDMPEARQRWAEFAESAIARFAGRVRHFEIGSTPNRHSWSGYTPSDYAETARLAQEALREWSQRNPRKPCPRLIGPNISDFAPYFTVALMDACARAERASPR